METFLAVNSATTPALVRRKHRFDYIRFFTRSAPLLAGLFLFLAARSIVWAQQVSLDNFELLLAGALPFAAFAAVRQLSETTALVRIESIDEQSFFWGWALSLFIYVLLHSIHSFEQIEGPIREYLAPGIFRYGLYGCIYTVMGYVVVIAARMLIKRSVFSRVQFLLLAAGMLLNAIYFGFSVFLVRL